MPNTPKAQEPKPDYEAVANLFHHYYETLAINFGYETRRESAKPWSLVPIKNRELMEATVKAVFSSTAALDALGLVKKDDAKTCVSMYCQNCNEISSNDGGATIVVNDKMAKLKAAYAALADSHGELLGLLKIAKCPDCDGSGVILVRTSEHRTVSRDMAMDACDPSLEGSTYSQEEWESSQCQWCDESKRAIATAQSLQSSLPLKGAE